MSAQSGDEAPSQALPVPATISAQISPNAKSELYEVLAVESETRPLQLVEFVLWPPRQGERDGYCSLWPDLRFSHEPLLTKGWRILVHLKRAIIEADLIGCTVVQGTRLGDVVRPLAVVSRETQERRTDVSTAKAASGSVAANTSEGLTAQIGANLKGVSESHERLARTTETESVLLRVSTLPHNRWQVQEPEGRLNGTYLRAPSPDERGVSALCEVELESTEFGISLSLLAIPQDLDLEFEPRDETRPWPVWRSEEKINKYAVAKLLLQKAQTGEFRRQSEEFVIAHSSMRGRKLTKIAE